MRKSVSQTLFTMDILITILNVNFCLFRCSFLLYKHIKRWLFPISSALHTRQRTDFLTWGEDWLSIFLSETKEDIASELLIQL